jgi:uncharacterized membrane protein YraQ (UPF0718 family)
MKDLLRNKCFILTGLLVVGIAIQFWAGSRLPALDQKAMMAGTAAIEPLAFDTVFVVQDDDPVWEKIVYGFVNWAKTNQRGMTFGFMFAAGIRSLLSMFKRKRLEGHFSNSALGVMIGTPLGVCVNCAAPIARGLHASGMRLETTLAAMISSPTLNVIVLTMVISLFPFYMVALKIGGTLFFLFIVIPLLSKYFFKEEVLATSGEHQIKASTAADDAKYIALDAVPPTETEENSWLHAIKWLVISYIRNLWFILRSTLPLMILAGVLGVMVVTFIPLDTLSDIMPSSSKFMIFIAMCITAVVGVFLPVPITFDIIVTAVLMAAGMPVKYAMILLFTLGIFSIYSFLIVQNAISRKVGLVLYLVIAVMGVGTGLIAHEYDKWYTVKKEAFLFESWAQQEEIKIDLPAADAGAPANEVLAQLSGNELQSTPVKVKADSGISVSALGLNAATAASQPFSRTAGPDLGIDMPYQFSVVKWNEPHSEFHGISSGDVHNDGWMDVLVTSERGVNLYANTGGSFIGQAIDVEGLHDVYVVNAALVDINNDGWLDLYYSTYRQGNFLIYNDKGAFTEANQVRLPNRDDAWMTSATAFADLDQDGDLDIVVGNWLLGSWLSRRNRGRAESTNIILWNQDDGFEIEELTGEPGETLTMMVSDFSGDGIPDLIVGNDFEVPDFYYLGKGGGELQLLKRKDKMIERSTLLTMSISAADINNDLRQEIYLGNASGTDRSDMQPIEDICSESEGTVLHEGCQTMRLDQLTMHATLRRGDPFMCSSLSSPAIAEQCIGMQLFNESWWKNRPDMCEQLENRFQVLNDVCTKFFSYEDVPMDKAFYSMVQQGARRTNVMLVATDEGEFKFSDKALEYNLREAGWVWNAQFADLDQDGWQDIYIANGMFLENTTTARESNHFFRNDGGTKFVDETSSAGLLMHAENSSYTYVDFDNDGDLDIFAVEQLGPVWAFVNNHADNQAVTFELRDTRGNHFGIGSKLIAKLSDGTSQMRELRSSGGFISYNAPVIHFGIGGSDGIESLEVQWSTGEKTVVEGDFAPGRRYVISRQ